ncbi:hypothetical protein Tsubulata_008997 [Turnera subulata]|uniref:Beta-fructofuranosidase n=1 Tax=Turnera subulata TaxID=218843 RepID=A0A9Q0FK25_9ROSI|nr:hypothetical protein Tsubulata_008997 [Turnera subulata]
MPFKIAYPALEGQEWKIITGSDPKNTPWSYHNGGSWPTLLWQELVNLPVGVLDCNSLLTSIFNNTFLPAYSGMHKDEYYEIAEKAIKLAERRISRDQWPEYYDTKRARFIGKQSRLFQTWSIAGYLVSKLLLANPSGAKMLVNEEDPELVNALISANPRRKRVRKAFRQPLIVYFM